MNSIFSQLISQISSSLSELLPPDLSELVQSIAIDFNLPLPNNIDKTGHEQGDRFNEVLSAFGFAGKEDHEIESVLKTCRLKALIRSLSEVEPGAEDSVYTDLENSIVQGLSALSQKEKFECARAVLDSYYDGYESLALFKPYLKDSPNLVVQKDFYAFNDFFSFLYQACEEELKQHSSLLLNNYPNLLAWKNALEESTDLDL